MNIKINSAYNHFFPLAEGGERVADWNQFKQYQAEKNGAREPDFSVTEVVGWKERAGKIALVCLKIIILPWGLYEGVRSLTRWVVMLLVYPAQLTPSKTIAVFRKSIERYLQDNEECVGKEVVLEKNGVRYSGLLVGKRSTIGNGKWAIFASGNSATCEGVFLTNGEQPFHEAGYNALFVNGPGVGRSQGPVTAENIGNAQEVGISFLESAVKAKRIVLAGHSLGAAAIGRAVVNHKFKEDVHYLALRIMTFDRLSNIAGKMAGNFGKRAVTWTGSEMDSVLASKKLQDEGIHEVVFKAEQDAVIGETDLLDALFQSGHRRNKTFYKITNATHCDLPRSLITSEIQKWDRFVENGHSRVQDVG